MEPAIYRQMPERHGSVEGLTILAIDDTPMVVQIFAKGLELKGQRVLTALSGMKGLELFREHVVDAVLCDLNMPGMDGWEVGRAIRDICLQRKVPKPPFILVTGSTDSITDRKMEESGTDAVIAKPADVSQLMEVITETLAHNQR